MNFNIDCRLINHCHHSLMICSGKKTKRNNNGDIGEDSADELSEGGLAAGVKEKEREEEGEQELEIRGAALTP